MILRANPSVLRQLWLVSKCPFLKCLPPSRTNAFSSLSRDFLPKQLVSCDVRKMSIVGRSREGLCACPRNDEPIRLKSSNRKGKKSKDDDEEDEGFVQVSDDSYDEEEKVVDVQMYSLRLDLVLKTGLRISRNKVEDAFYESRVRRNGHKVLKKSVQVSVGDELDIVKGVNSKSDRYLDVMRLHIAAVKVPTDKDANIVVTCHRYKHLTVDNYADRWHGEYMNF